MELTLAQLGIVLYASWAIAKVTTSEILENREEDKRGAGSVIIIDTLSRN